MSLRNSLAWATARAGRARRALPLRRVLLLVLLAFFGASCAHPVPLGLEPLGPPVHAVVETELALPASLDGAEMEGALIRPGAPEGAQFPCAVLLHGKGGWWQAYNRYARELAARGFASLNLNYYSVHRVDLEGWRTPFQIRKTSFEAQTADIIRATRQFARSPFCAGGKVAMVGFSLGADKAFRAAAALPEVAAVVAYYGPYDYVSFIQARVNPVVLALASEDLLQWKKYMEEASPILLAPMTRVPVFLLHGMEDSVIPVDQSLKMREILQKQGNPVTLKLYDGTGHNFVLRRGPTEVRDDSLRLAIGFLQKHLPAAKPPAARTLEAGTPSSPLPGTGG